jgi:23S rRNA pseudouridine1911/1915/1917 synthase
MKENSTKKVVSTPANLRVLYEDNHLIAVNKRPGDIVQGDKTGDAPLSDVIKQYIKKKYKKPGDVFLGTVHRLDRPVSGVVLYARTSKALERLNELFRNKTLKKTYWAIVHNSPKEEEGRLLHYLVKDESKNKAKAFNYAAPHSKEAVLNYRIIGKGDRYTFLDVDLETGRHHQIRIQLSTIGCPIKGDLKYGAERSNKDASICLHARKLEFLHPVKKEPIEIVAPVPAEKIWTDFEKLAQIGKA